MNEHLFLTLFITGVAICPITIACGSDIVFWFYKNVENSRFAMPIVYLLNGILNVSIFALLYKIIGYIYGN